MKFFKSFNRLQHVLMMAFLVISITPLTLTALFFLNSHITDLEKQTFNHLSLLRDNKSRQIERYFDNKQQESLAFASSELANASGGRFYGLVGAFKQLANSEEEAREIAQSHYIKGYLSNEEVDLSTEGTLYIANQRYRLIHKRYQHAFEQYLARSEFKNIYLVDMNGNVAYSVDKDHLFGENLVTGEFANTAPGETFQALRQITNKEWQGDESSPFMFTDFSYDENLAMNVAWLAAPIIQQGYLHSFVLFKLPTTGMDELLSEKMEDQTYINTVLIGADNLLRSHNLSSLPAEPSKEYLGKILGQSPRVERLINLSNKAVLSAFTPVNVLGNPWTLIVEMPEEDAFSHIDQLEKVFLLAMTAAILLVIIVSHWLSNSITAPLLRVTWAAERVSAGDLDQDISGTDRPDEIGRLAISFARMQRSVREKLQLIREQNAELERNLTTIQQKNQELETADTLKDEFLATTSHELRTPLHGMIGIAESLQAGINGPVPHQQMKQLQMIINSGQRLSTLVDDLLDYHKMRYGNLEINQHATDLGTAVRLVLELSQHLLGSKPVRIINQIPVDLPLVSADEQRLEQVLYNLVGNAIKYTTEGKIVLSATVLDNEVRVQVVDTGQGIPAEELEHIFEPLIQASTYSSRYRQGTGLGLTISRQLIELMGGHLYVSSQPMVGATFSFTLNKATEEQKANCPALVDHFHAPLQEASSLDEYTVSPENSDGDLILVVDDEPVNLQIVSNYLRMAGYRVMTADSGKVAIEQIAEQVPKALLLDVMMPEVNGYEVCTYLRSQAETEALPIIMLSALSQPQDRIKGFEVGASDYLHKPFNKEELLARIRAHLRAAKVAEEQANNQRLMSEIEHRKQIEQGLLETQGRLLNLLESTAEAILCIQADGRIRYANLAAAQLLSTPAEILERLNIQDYMADLSQLEDIKSIESLHFQLQGESHTWPAHVLPMPEPSGLHAMIVLSHLGPSNQYRVEMLENAVEALSEFAFDGDKSNLQQLRELGGEFTRLADKLSQDEKSKGDIIRELTANAMNECLQLWESSTGKTKFALAEESGLWRVYLDRSTLQTRTLDKYLHIDTMPKSPRWRTILNTLDFVLERSTQPSPERQKIEAYRDKIHHYTQQ